MRIALFTDAPAKDGALAGEISRLAQSIGGSATAKASIEGTFGSINTFELSYPAAGPTAPGQGVDDPTNPIPYVPSNDPIKATVTSEVQIFTIDTGSYGYDMTDLSSIAAANGGKLLSSSGGDDLVKILVGIIDGTVTSGDTITGTPDPDNLVGGALDDVISGLASNDILTGMGGKDQIDGGDGIDTSVYRAAASKYKVTFTAGLSTFTVEDRTGVDGIDTLVNVERVQFADATIDATWFAKTATMTKIQIDSLTEVYIASFNRAPDAIGLDYWGSRLHDGMSLEAIAKSFFVQPETAAKYPPSTTNESFATTVYGNVLGRTPDAGGLAYWVGELDHGFSRDKFLIAILNGAHANPSATLDVANLSNKVSVGEYYALTKGLNDGTWANDVMSGVTSDGATVGTANAKTDAYAAIGDTVDTAVLAVKILGIAA